MLKKLYFLPLLILFSITLVIGSFFDFQINNFLFSNQNPFGIFMAALGEYPAYALIAFFGTYLITCCFKFFLKENKKLFAHNLFCGSLAVALSIYYQGNAITNQNGYNIHDATKPLFFLLAFALLIPPFVLGAFTALKAKDSSKWRTVFYSLFALTIAILVVTLIKEIMHRPRFRFLITQDEVPFRNWWQDFKGYKDYLSASVTKEEFRSFPSGHVTITSSILFVPYLTNLYNVKNPRKTQIFLKIVCSLYIVLIAFTRMLVGAHFLSDVSIGGIISIVIFIVFIYFMNKKKLLD